MSPYRLAAHLATAFATFSLLVHTGFQVGGPSFLWGVRALLRPYRRCVHHVGPFVSSSVPVAFCSVLAQ